MENLGHGASGTVVRALHLETGQQVAIKYLSDRIRSEPHHRASFRAEAVLLGNLRSPYVARLFQYVQEPGGSAIVMELVAGASLSSLLEREGRLPGEAALLVLKGSLLGLSAAHRVGVVHRDYKPANVIVTPEGRSKLIDFGIAVPNGTDADPAGTPSYMAPEQWTGGGIGPAADVYAATATFYECLTGERPYGAATLVELAVQHSTAAIPYGKAPAFAHDLIRRGLAKDPGARPGDAERFLESLEAAAQACFGTGWEERGRRRLAALAAALLIDGHGISDSGGGPSDAASTRLPGPARHRRTSAGVRRAAALRGGRTAAVVAALAGLASYGVFAWQGSANRAGEAVANVPDLPEKDEDEPGVRLPTPTPSPTPSPTATPAGPAPVDRGAAAGPSPVLSAVPSPVRPAVWQSPNRGGNPTPDRPQPAPPEPSHEAAPPLLSDAAAPSPVVPDPVLPDPVLPDPEVPADPAPDPVVVAPTRVVRVDIGRLDVAEDGRVTAPVSVVTDGTGPVTLSVRWSSSYSTAGDAESEPEGPVETFVLEGRTDYVIRPVHTFNLLCHALLWNVDVDAVAVDAHAAPEAGSERSRLRRATAARCIETPR
ncbi:protein kinase [Streptomyces sp. NPDC056485]|uniref:serine/threonine-protein kinase n=1 Tax=Streptomyces sp. NPDC056485 TaxID=3345834 RepID=UPI00369D011D